MPLERGDYESSPKWIWAANDNALTNATPGRHDFRFSIKLAQKPTGEAKATYDSSYRPITSNWRADGNSIKWDVVVPPNTTSLIYLPGGVAARILEGVKDIRQSAGVSLVLKYSHHAIYEAGAGSYTFTIEE